MMQRKLAKGLGNVLAGLALVGVAGVAAIAWVQSGVCHTPQAAQRKLGLSLGKCTPIVSALIRCEVSWRSAVIPLPAIQLGPNASQS